ncbi:MAG: carbohydrate porin [Proteobacteria bacterium]|nr:carbohydrate porin [Pseudomonadota bacterium]
MKICTIPILVALIAIPAAAFAADDADLRTLREEVARLRETYEKRIEALEKRLIQTEAKAASAETIATRAETVAAPQPTASGGGGTNAFNPGISLILSGLYSNLSKDPAGYRISGFHLPNDPLGEITPQRGFSLAESELGISANVDQLFYGAMNFSIHPDNTVSTEEAFIQTTSLPQGLTLKAGRYFSGIGYLNEQHAHTWDFVDAPLAYQAFVGGQFNNDGLQLRWLAPTDTFLEIGAELGRGANYPGTGRNKNGSGASAIFAHLGGDVGASHSWRAGLSLLTTSPQDRQWDDTDVARAPVTNSFSGSSKLWIVDGVWKWAPNGNANQTNFKLQGEYLRRIEDGKLTYDANAASLGASVGSYAATQSGWYVQGIYQFAPYWRVGLRTERLDNGTVDYGSNNASLLRPVYAPARNALMLDYNPSEFSRVRLQFAQDKSLQGVTDNQIFLQYQMSLGAHGAHKF